MEYKRLFLWVEGDDDLRFFDQIIKPAFERKYDWVEVRSYAHLKKEKVDNYLKSIDAMNADYFFVTDIDTAPCVTYRKQAIRHEFSNLDTDKIIVVIKEIESWYLAGLDNICCKKYKIPPSNRTDEVIKEHFDSLIPREFEGSRIVFLQEILKYFQVETAKQKNKSFRHFLEKQWLD